MNDSSPRAPSRRWRLQFSLRLALLALTAFAIGFPLWYRWPYVEVFEQKPTGASIKRITTWQRQWGGGRLQHGKHSIIATFPRSQLTQTSMYAHGVANGPYRETENGNETVRGQFVDGLKEGEWVHQSVDPRGKNYPTSTYTMHWHKGKLHGTYTIEHYARRVGADKPTLRSKLTYIFDSGRLKEIEGRPVRSPLFDLLAAGELDSEKRSPKAPPVSEELRKQTTMEFVEQPLADVVLYLTEQHQLPIMLDNLKIPDVTIPMTAEHKGLDLCSGLTLLTASYNLACDFRYGLVWITTPEDTENWHDPTGVADIHPKEGSALSRAWNEPAGLEAVYQPLAPLLESLVQRLAIQLDTTQIAPTPANPNAHPLTLNARGLPFRHILGLALYNTGCRCRLDGEKLVILPPQVVGTLRVPSPANGTRSVPTTTISRPGQRPAAAGAAPPPASPPPPR